MIQIKGKAVETAESLAQEDAAREQEAVEQRHAEAVSQPAVQQALEVLGGEVAEVNPLASTSDARPQE